MFARIMAVVLAVILVTTVALSAVWWFTLRNQQIDARLDYLISEAEAFLERLRDVRHHNGGGNLGIEQAEHRGAIGQEGGPMD